MSNTWRSTVFDIVINQKMSADRFGVYTSFIFSFLVKQPHMIIWFHLLLFDTALWELKHSWKLTKKKLTETNEKRGSRKHQSTLKGMFINSSAGQGTIIFHLSCKSTQVKNTFLKTEHKQGISSQQSEKEQHNFLKEQGCTADFQLK